MGVCTRAVARDFIMLKPTKNENEEISTLHIANTKGADQSARMRRLVCALIVRKQQSQGFSRRGQYDVEARASCPPPGYARVLSDDSPIIIAQPALSMKFK